MTHESDVCIVGGGISAAMLAQKLTELKPGLAITIVEAGSRVFDFENRDEVPAAQPRLRRERVAATTSSKTRPALA